MASPLDAQYLCLAELKEIDDRLFLVDRDVQRIPGEIQAQDDAIALKRRDLDAAKAQFSEAEKKLRATERELKEKEEALFKAEGKMMEVKTNEEYQAAIKENENQKKFKGVLEDKVLQLIAALEEQKKAIVGIEAEFKVNAAAILNDKNKLTGEHQELLKTLASMSAQRDTLSAKLDPAIALLYKKILSAKGSAIAMAEQGRCMGCNIQVRAQIYNEVLGRKAVHRCSNCGKILIVPPRALEDSIAANELAAK